MCGGQRHTAECDCASVECIVNKNRRSKEERLSTGWLRVRSKGAYNGSGCVWLRVFRPQGHRTADEQQSHLTQGTRGLVSHHQTTSHKARRAKHTRQGTIASALEHDMRQVMLDPGICTPLQPKPLRCRSPDCAKALM